METILVSFAHPDDESFFTAGILRKYSEAGFRIVLVSATSGEQGSAGDPPLCSREDLGRVREEELHRAAAALGIEEVHCFRYPDKQLASAPQPEVREKLVRLIRLHRPRIVITFDPNGVNSHPDHVAAGRFSIDAVAAAADPRWHPENGDPHQPERVLWTAPARPYLMGITENLASEPGIDFLVDVRPWSSQKAQALLAHATQRKSVNRHFFDNADCDRRLGVEALRLGWGIGLAKRPSTDLLDGID